MWQFLFGAGCGWFICAVVNCGFHNSMKDRIRWLETDKEDLEGELLYRVMIDRRHDSLRGTNYVNFNRDNLN